MRSFPAMSVDGMFKADAPGPKMFLIEL